MNAIDEHCVRVCNSLLRGELAAVEAYGFAIEKHTGLPLADNLREIRAHHISAAKELTENIRELGGIPETNSGGWGVFAKLVHSDLFEAGSVLESLKKSEEIGRDDYENALRDQEVMADAKIAIRNTLLPRAIEHIHTLDELAQAA